MANRGSHPPMNTMNASTAQPMSGMLRGAEMVASKAVTTGRQQAESRKTATARVRWRR